MEKEAVKQRLEKFNFKFKESKIKLTVNLGFSLIVEIDFSEENKVLINERLVSWNPLTGIIPMKLKNAFIYNFVDLIFIPILFIILISKPENPSIMIFLCVFVLSWIFFWTIFYHIKAENFKTQLLNWFEQIKI